VSGTPFALGTFSAADGRPFPGVVLADQVMPVHGLAPGLHRKGIGPDACASVLGLLEHWPAAIAALELGIRETLGKQQIGRAHV
jgi:hypothetical protein